MKVLYTKTFSKDLERLKHDVELKKRLLHLIEQMKQIDSLMQLENVRKIQGPEDNSKDHTPYPTPSRHLLISKPACSRQA